MLRRMRDSIRRRQQGHLVVAVQMILVVTVAKRHAREQLIGDVRIARRGHEDWEPIEAGEDTVLDRAPA